MHCAKIDRTFEFCGSKIRSALKIGSTEVWLVAEYAFLESDSLFCDHSFGLKFTPEFACHESCVGFKVRIVEVCVLEKCVHELNYIKCPAIVEVEIPYRSALHVDFFH